MCFFIMYKSMFDQRDRGLELDLAFKSQIGAWSLNLKCLQLSYKRWSENVEKLWTI